MNPWGSLWSWYNDDSETQSELNNTNYINNEESLPSDFDEWSWWNPADWGGNYDKNLADYEDRKKLENESKNRIFIYIASSLLAIYMIKK